MQSRMIPSNGTALSSLCTSTPMHDLSKTWSTLPALMQPIPSPAPDPAKPPQPIPPIPDPGPLNPQPGRPPLVDPNPDPPPIDDPAPPPSWQPVAKQWLV